MRIQTNRLKSILRVAFAFIAGVIFTSLPLSVWGQTTDKDKSKQSAQTPKKIHVEIEFGAQGWAEQGSHPAKFEEVRDVPKGLFVQKLRLNFISADSPYFFAVTGDEIRERDQRFTVDAGRFGKYRTEFMWDQVPHHFGTGQSFLVRTAPGYYSVSPTLRAALQAVTQSDATRTPVNGPLPTLVRQELATAPLTESRLRRDQALFKQSYWFSDKVELYAQFSWLRNNGTRPMGVGTFVRRPVPGNGLPDIGGSWEGIGQEFLEPIEQRTYNLKVGAQFRGKRLSAGAEYALSLFRNHIPSLTFENPFRVTDDEGCTPNPAPPPTLTCGASNRFREVHWQNALAPNNDSSTITVWGSLNLRPQTQLRGVFSLAYWTQNDPFLAWTLNTAINPQLWNAASPPINPTDVTQLPARSLNGKMRNINQEYAFVNHSNNFRFQAQYRSQALDNQSPTISFPGYAAFGDSTWRSPVTDFYNLPIEDLDWDFRRQNVDAGLQWDLICSQPSSANMPRQKFCWHNSSSKKPQLTWRLDYDWEIWNRKFRDVNRNNEHSIRNRLDYSLNFLSGEKKGNAAKSTATGTVKPSITTLRLKLDYRYANRRPQAYNTQALTHCAPPDPNCPSTVGGAPASSPQDAWVVTRTTVMKVGVPMEFNLLRRFDETGRIRNDGTAQVELLKGENTTFSASYRYLGDEYDKSFYGLLFNRTSFIDAEFTHTFDNGSYVYANYSREMNRYMYRDLAHLLPNPPAPPGTIVQGTLAQYPIANTWERASRNSLDSFEFGINAAPQQGKFQKWEFDLSYALSFARDRITTTNPFAVRADSILHAGGNPYPDTLVRRHDLNIAVTRKIREDLEVGARYWYEPYSQNDFSYNLMAPYVHGLLTSDTPKYLFEDARYGSYHTNVGTVFVRYRF